MEMQSSRS